MTTRRIVHKGIVLPDAAVHLGGPLASSEWNVDSDAEAMAMERQRRRYAMTFARENDVPGLGVLGDAEQRERVPGFIQTLDELDALAVRVRAGHVDDLAELVGAAYLAGREFERCLARPYLKPGFSRFIALEKKRQTAAARARIAGRVLLALDGECAGDGQRGVREPNKRFRKWIKSAPENIDRRSLDEWAGNLNADVDLTDDELRLLAATRRMILDDGTLQSWRAGAG